MSRHGCWRTASARQPAFARRTEPAASAGKRWPRGTGSATDVLAGPVSFSERDRRHTADARAAARWRHGPPHHHRHRRILAAARAGARALAQRRVGRRARLRAGEAALGDAAGRFGRHLW